MKSKQVISTKEFQEFIKCCREYCAYLEDTEEIDSTLYLIQLQKLLLNLYSNGLNLKSVDLDSRIAYFERKFDQKEFELLKNRVSKSIGEHQCYWYIFDPTENVFGNETPIMGDLPDDILDVYLDIKREIKIFDLGTDKGIEHAVWSMKFLFWHHWGDHAVDAIRTIHYVLEKTEKYK